MFIEHVSYTWNTDSYQLMRGKRPYLVQYVVAISEITVEV